MKALECVREMYLRVRCMCMCQCMCMSMCMCICEGSCMCICLCVCMRAHARSLPPPLLLPSLSLLLSFLLSLFLGVLLSAEVTRNDTSASNIFNTHSSIFSSCLISFPVLWVGYFGRNSGPTTPRNSISML